LTAEITSVTRELYHAHTFKPENTIMNFSIEEAVHPNNDGVTVLLEGKQSSAIEPPSMAEEW
jgi:hypothetical protein